MLGRRGGYWSAEALVGAELLLLGLPAISFVRAYEGGMVGAF